MYTLLNWIPQGLLVAGITAAALPLLRRRHPAFRYRIWWTALVIVLLLPAFSSSLGRSSGASAVAAGAGASLRLPAVPQGLADAGAIATLVLWIGWVVVQGSRAAIAFAALRRVRVACRPFPSDRASRLPCWTRHETRGRRTGLVLSNDIYAAAVLGIHHPVVAIAPHLLERLSDDELDCVAMHEWAHVQRHDDKLNVIQLLIRTAVGWHPAVWWIDRQLHREREAACDQLAARVTGSAKAYAASLMKLASLRLEPAYLPLPAVLTSSDLGHRIVRVLEEADRRPARGSRAATAVILLVLAGGSGWAAGIQVVAATAPDMAPDQAGAQAVPHFTPGPEETIVSAAPRVAPVTAVTHAARTTTFAMKRVRPGKMAQATTAAGAVQSGIDPPAPLLSAGVPSLGANAGSELPVMPGLPVSNEIPQAGSILARPSAPAPPWDTAAQAGLAIGRGSRKAAVSTAGFFNRLGRKMAGAF